MTAPVISEGESVVIISRRLFPDDVRRHFIGTVLANDEVLIRVQGHAWIANSIGRFEQRQDERVRVISMAHGGDIVLVVPAHIDIGRLRYVSASGRLTVTDGSGYVLDISEFGVAG
jgi:hypothetical protein